MGTSTIVPIVILFVLFVLLIVTFSAHLQLLAQLRKFETTLEQHQLAIDSLTQQVGRAEGLLRARARAVADTVAQPSERPSTSQTVAPAPGPPPSRVLRPPEAARPSRTSVDPPHHPPPATPDPAPSLEPHDFESLVGVRLFSAIAAIALVLAGIFFLRYSIDRGWLSPPVRVAIGVSVSLMLLGICELKAARRYWITANAMDAAAITILFSTFFAAHVLWRLVSLPVAFALLGLVTVVAVLLSIRRDSLFIAILGLVGGFATPVLLSTGENRPISLFTYLLLLNVGLAWVASRRKWPILTILTVVLTALYQWDWVNAFLDASQLPLAMGIFLVFAITTAVALTIRSQTANALTEWTLARVGLAASVMPLAFTWYLAAIPAYGAHAGLLFGYILLLDAGILAIAIRRQNEWLHAAAGIATLLVFVTWLAVSYVSAAWRTAIIYDALLATLYTFAPFVAARVGQPFTGAAQRSVYVAPLLLAVFPVVARIEPAAAFPLFLFGTMFLLLVLLAWRALATANTPVYFIAAFFALAAEGAWSVTFLTAEQLGPALALYGAFGLFFIGVPVAGRLTRRPLSPPWGGGAVLLAGIALLVCLALGPRTPLALWGLAVLLAILDAGVFIESASGRFPLLSLAGGLLSWLVLAVWWAHAAASVGVQPSLLFIVAVTLLMLGGHAWAHHVTGREREPAAGSFEFRSGIFLALVGHVFLFNIAAAPQWASPPWPILGALLVMTLATSTASLAVREGYLHAAGLIASAIIVFVLAVATADGWSRVSLAATEAVVAWGLAWLPLARRVGSERAGAFAAIGALFIGELVVMAMASADSTLTLATIAPLHVVNIVLILALAWKLQSPSIAPAATLPAWLAAVAWHQRDPQPAAWTGSLALAAALYATFVAYPFVLARRAREARAPYLAAVAASGLLFVPARAAFVQGGLTAIIGIVPLVESVVLALMVRQLLGLQAPRKRDQGRLALVAGAALAFATVAIPLQLKNQWITIGWALEGAALCWLYRRIPHRGLLYSALGLLGAVFVRLALNPSVLLYEPRGPRVFNWYLYAYAICASALFAAGWWLSGTDDRLGPVRTRPAAVLRAAGILLLFLLLNIEIADYYASGPAIVFRFGATLAQDLTYTIAWLAFGLGLLTAGISLHSHAGRVAAIALLVVTVCKAFLYDIASLGGLYRVASFAGLAASLAVVAVVLEKFVLRTARRA